MRFKKAREAKGLSQKYVAYTLGVKPPNVSRWEAGINYPTVENLIALARLYECSIDYLLENDKEGSTIYVTSEELELIQKYRAASREIKNAARAVLSAAADQHTIKEKEAAAS